MDLQNKMDEAIQRINVLETVLEEKTKTDNELKALIESLDDQIFQIEKDDDNDYIITFNEGKIAESFNLKTEQIKGNKIRNMIGEELYSTLKPHYDSAFEGEIVRYRGFSRNDRYYSTVLTPFKRSEDETVTVIIGNTQDITEQYFTEEKFKEKTETLNYIIDHNPYGIQICDSKGYHLKANKAFIDLFMFPPPPEWSLFNDPALQQSGFNERFNLLKQGEIINTPPIWYNPHNFSPQFPDNPICIGTVIFPVFLSDDKLENVVLMFEDITNSVKADEDLIKRIEELEAFHDLTVDRELKMKLMEEQIEELKKLL